MTETTRQDVDQLIELVTKAWQPIATARRTPITDPATGSQLFAAPVAEPDGVTRAVATARGAASGWSATPAAARGSALAGAADAVAAVAADLALLTTLEMGKPLREAAGGVAAGVATLRQYAELGPLHRGRALNGALDATDLMVPEPRGVVAALTPWNDPVAVSCGLIGAALATGNTVVYKPSERTPATGWLLAEALTKALPAGTLNLLLGDRTTGAALAAAAVDVVAHVGSTETGRAITAAVRPYVKVLLENGGNDPLVIDEGVPIEWAADQAALGAFTNAGQICVSVERIYVPRSILEPFAAALVDRAVTIRQGPGLAPDTELGPLVDESLRQSVHQQVTAAIAAGAELCCGGTIPDRPGSFYPATVLTGCTDQMAVVATETFGPVAAVVPVDSFASGLASAAKSTYGLAATVLTDDLRRAQLAARSLPCGTVKINNVFGGAPGGAAHPRLGSGQGFGYGPELLDEMTFTKVIHLEPIPAAARP